MATDESSFKTEFRNNLESHYGLAAHIHTNNDMFRAGLPDFSAQWIDSLHRGWHFAIEGKYAEKIPKRDSSLLLKHELSKGQAEYLKRHAMCGGASIILVGMAGTCVAVPIELWPRDPEGQPETNITLGAIKEVAAQGFKFDHVPGRGWQIQGFFEKYVRGKL